MNEHKNYLTKRVPELVAELKTDMDPTFGIMTPQHMVEHLIWVIKSATKDFGPPPETFTEGQQKFMRFIEKGANFKYMPSDKKASELDPPRMSDLQSAIDVIPEAIQRLYSHSEDHVFFNPFMGKVSFSDMELMQAQHFKWHLEEQYGLGKKDS